jgi:hypothetical protein
VLALLLPAHGCTRFTFTPKLLAVGPWLIRHVVPCLCFWGLLLWAVFLLLGGSLGFVPISLCLFGYLSAMAGEKAMEDMNIHSFIPFLKLALGLIDIQIINIVLFEELT